MSNLIFLSRGLPNLIKSAGDIRALMMLKILRKKYNIDVIARSADYGESDVKGIGCTTHLSGNPQTTIQQIISSKFCEVIILSHWTVAQESIRYLRSVTKAKIIIDTIDVEFLRFARKFVFDGINKDKVKETKVNELEVYSLADALIVASEPDKAELSAYYNFKFIDLPCLYSINNAYQVNEGKNSYIICNWMHEPNIASTIYLCKEIMPKLDIPFYVVGKHPPESIRVFESNKITIKGAEYEIEKFLMKMNVLLCPVFYGAGVNGKILQAISFGIPVVTSSLGALPIGLEHRKTAMIADSTEDFISCVNEVLNDKELRQSLSVNGKELAKKFTVDYWQDKFLKNIQEV